MAWVTNFLKKKRTHLLGVDWRGNSVKILALSQQSGRLQVEGYAEEPFLSEPIKELEIKDVDEIARALRQALQRVGTSSKDAAIALSSSHVVIQTIEIENKANERQLLVQIYKHLKQYFPYALEEMHLDFQVIGPSLNQTGFNDVLVVACKKQTIETLRKLMRLAGLHLKVVDVQSYAMERSYQMMSGAENLLSENHIALVEFDTHSITLQVLYNGKTQYVREHNGGEKENLAGEEIFEDLAKQVGRALQYFYSAMPLTSLEKIYIAGRAALHAGLAEHLQMVLNLKVSAVNPFKEISISSHLDPGLLMAQAPTLMTCCGLTLRGCQDDPTY